MEIGLFLACINVASFAAATCIVHHAAFSAVTLKTTAQDPLQREDRDPNETDNAEVTEECLDFNTASQIPYFVGLRPERKTELRLKCLFKNNSVSRHAERVLSPKTSQSFSESSR